jgi:allophanate hydrolase
MMVETGFADSYTENWHRSDRTNGPCAALALQALGDGCAASIVRVGRTFMVARDRATTLSEGHLRDHVAKATSLEAAQDLVDCEISFGAVTNDGWRIDRSTLPYRVGRLLAPQITGRGLSTADVDPWGRPIVRRWTITAEDGGFAVE